MQEPLTHHPASYRDPSGFIYIQEGALYRQVNKYFAVHYDFFIDSGCYDHLVKAGLLITHTHVENTRSEDEQCHAVLMPEVIPFISYPYEWCFDMLRDAALLTLRLLKEALSFNMILKDATPYNIQWYKGKLIFIDTLSFEKNNDAEPWVAYRQFCEQFLAPLVLAHYKSIPPHTIMRAWPDGIPVDIAATLLPFRSRFSLHTYLHIHLNGRVRKKKSSTSKEASIKFNRKKLLNIIGSLEILIKKLQWKPVQSVWSDYYQEAAERDNYLVPKEQIIASWLRQLNGIKTATDLGANDGKFSKMAAAAGIATVATDFDSLCINNLYRAVKNEGEVRLLPLVMDLSDPSPAMGVNNEERAGFTSRAKADLVIALALIHHLCIGKNIPLGHVARLLASLSGNKLIIEFVPKADNKVALMLAGRTDIFSQYTEDSFIREFEKYFAIEDKQLAGSSGRTLYLMKKK